jgi:hypothetical protein
MVGVSRAWQRWRLWLIPAGVCLLLIIPMAFTERTFAPDWTNDVWLVWKQGQSISDLGHPSYYLNAYFLGAFYPIFAFYGGTLWGVAGLLAVPFGPFKATFALYLFAFAAAYAGWTWLAMQAGVRGWVAFLPGCIAVTSPYVVTLAYGRGDLGESIATAMLPLAAASGLAIFLDDRLRAFPVAAFLLSVTLLTGSHAITLIWGTTVLLIITAAAAICWRELVRPRLDRVLQLAGLATLGVAINAWVLVPSGLYAQKTWIGENPHQLTHSSLTEAGVLFNPLRSAAQIPGVSADVQAQLPVLALACALVIGAVAWWGVPRERRLFAGVLAAVLAGILLLLLAPSLIDDFPGYWRYIQFPFRLLTYADLAVIGLLILALAGVRDRPRAYRAASLIVAVVAVISVVQATGQAYGARSWATFLDSTTPHGREIATLSQDFPPPTYYPLSDFAESNEPIVTPTLPGELDVPFTQSHGLDYDVSYPPGSAGTVATNVTTGSYLVAVDGAEIVGRTPDRHLVLRLPASSSARTVEFHPRHSVPVVAGQVLSVLALVVGLGLVCWLAVRSQLERRRANGVGNG